MTEVASLSDLFDDGDYVNLDDGRSVRLRIEPDQDTSVRDYECYGEFSEYAYDYRHDHHEPRPDGFDGDAEKIQVDRGLWMWWQPPRGDYALDYKRGTPEFATFRSFVIDLASYGFIGLIIEVWHSCGECSTRHEETTASIWGVEWGTDDAYRRTLISELLAEVGFEREEA